MVTVYTWGRSSTIFFSHTITVIIYIVIQLHISFFLSNFVETVAYLPQRWPIMLKNVRTIDYKILTEFECLTFSVEARTFVYKWYELWKKLQRNRYIILLKLRGKIIDVLLHVVIDFLYFTCQNISYVQQNKKLKFCLRLDKQCKNT